MKVQELKNKIEEAGKTNGTFEHVTMTDQAHHCCNPENDRMWAAPAVYICEESNMLKITEVVWDFSSVENYDEIEDSSDYPWEVEEFMSIGDELDWMPLDDSEDIELAANRV